MTRKEELRFEELCKNGVNISHKWKLNENNFTINPDDIPLIDMPYDEFCAKYNLIPLDDAIKRLNEKFNGEV
jgi:hypothetical protein